MAAPIQLKANKPGGNSYSKSLSAQKSRDGSKASMATKPGLRNLVTKRSGDGSKATSGKAEVRSSVPKAVLDYTVRWMSQHEPGFGRGKSRIPYASVPADLVGASGTPKTSVRKPAARKSASVNPSGKTTAKRVKTTYTGKSFKTTPKARVIKSR